MKMRHIGRLALWLIFGFNAVFAGGLLFAAYSPHIDPVAHPIRSCAGLAFPIFLIANACFMVFWLIFQFKFALLSVLALIVCASQIRTYVPINFRTKVVPDKSIKVLSYNVMGFGGLRKTAEGNEILSYIRDSGADIICLQEFAVASGRGSLTEKDVGGALKNYPYKTIHKTGKPYGLACYSKFPIISSRIINYKSDFNGSAIYEIKIGEDTVTVINNHLESNKLTDEDKHIYEGILTSPETAQVKEGILLLIRKLGEASAIRSPQIDEVAREIAATPNETVIVCGDFNDTPISRAHYVISKGLKDAFTESGCGFGVSYNRNRFHFRIDNILISKNLKSYNCTVDRSINASDHYPMWCYINKK